MNRITATVSPAIFKALLVHQDFDNKIGVKQSVCCICSVCNLMGSDLYLDTMFLHKLTVLNRFVQLPWDGNFTLKMTSAALCMYKNTTSCQPAETSVLLHRDRRVALFGTGWLRKQHVVSLFLIIQRLCASLWNLSDFSHSESDHSRLTDCLPPGDLWNCLAI